MPVHSDLRVPTRHERESVLPSRLAERRAPQECMQLQALRPPGADGTWVRCVLNGPWAPCTLDVPRVQATSVLPGCPIHVLF